MRRSRATTGQLITRPCRTFCFVTSCARPGATDWQCTFIRARVAVRFSESQVSAVAIGRFTPLSVGDKGRTERAWAEPVSANYFDVLEVKPVLGRTFLAEEGRDREGGYP